VNKRRLFLEIFGKVPKAERRQGLAGFVPSLSRILEMLGKVTSAVVGPREDGIVLVGQGQKNIAANIA
jgi:hypothetical protein